MGLQRSRGNRLSFFRENSTSIQSPWSQTKNERFQYTKTRRTFACQARTRHSDSFKMNSIGLSEGNSLRHGGHQLAQKFTSTTMPRY